MWKRLVITTFLAVLATASAVSCTKPREAAAPAEKVTLAYTATTYSVLVQIAHDRGFFQQEGVEPVAHLFPYGKPALDDLLAGKADFATVAEPPVMFSILNKEPISIVATIQTSKTGHAIVARRDRGIRACSDLRGKKVAVAQGTTSDFYLDALLGMNGISRKELQVVDVKGEAMVEALARGYVDAASTFPLYSILAQKRLGKGGITFREEDLYRWTFNLVASKEFIRNNPGKVQKVLRALVRAEEFVREKPAEAKAIVARLVGLDAKTVNEVWSENVFAVTLDQALVLALEDESEWALKNRLTKATKIPNYLDFLYLEGLQSVRPGAVRILK